MHLWHEQQPGKGKTWTRNSASWWRLVSARPGRPGRSPRLSWEPLQVRPWGFHPGASACQSAPSWLLGRARRAKADFLLCPERDSWFPPAGIGPGELFAPLRGSQFGHEPGGLFPRNRHWTWQEKEAHARGSTLRCTAKCQKVNFLPDFFRGFQLTFPSLCFLPCLFHAAGLGEIKKNKTKQNGQLKPRKSRN